MKRYSTPLLLLSIAGTFVLGSCKKDESKIYYASGTTPVLTANASDSIALPVTDTTANAVTFSWTNPNYQFSDGVSSLDVTYYLEFDTTSGFNSPNVQTVAISSALSKTFTVSSLNNILANGLLLSTGATHTVLVRVEAFLSPYTSGSAAIAPMYSSTLNFQVSPYAPPPAINPPPTGTLFITGSATPEGWLNGTTAQQFTVVPGSKGLQFVDTIALTGNGEYKFIGNNNGYTYQYTIATSDDPTEIYGGAFISGSSNNILAPPASGKYIILVNFQTGKFTVTKQ